MRNSCGYTGHVCSDTRVQFISRYRCENDYCVAGKRVSVSDDGHTRNATADDIARIRLFELERYAAYCQWRADSRQLFEGTNIPIQPFDFPEVTLEL